MARKPPNGPTNHEFLSSYLPYLLNRVAREMLQGVDQKFQERGLTVSKWRILAVLSDRGVCRFGELAELTSIEPATLSRFVGRLVKEGLIRRRRSKSDARAVRIALTEAGEVLFISTLPWASEVENKMVLGLDGMELALLKRMLTMIYANIQSGPFDAIDGDGGSPPSAATKQATSS